MCHQSIACHHLPACQNILVPWEAPSSHHSTAFPVQIAGFWNNPMAHSRNVLHYFRNVLHFSRNALHFFRNVLHFSGNALHFCRNPLHFWKKPQHFWRKLMVYWDKLALYADGIAFGTVCRVWQARQRHGRWQSSLLFRQNNLGICRKKCEKTSKKFGKMKRNL